MKYIVMECHEGYAILMDEESRFVNAANLHYSVGQSVTDPIIMNNEENSRSIKMYVTRFAAVAACIGVLATAGSLYYSRNLKPYSTILISSEANIRMEINQKGKVIKIKSDDDNGKELLKDYNGKGKDKLTAAQEILELEKEKGLIANGDTVKVYVDSETSQDYDSFKDDLEKSNADLNVKVSGLDTPAPPAKEKEKVTNVRPDPAKETKAPDPPKPEKEKEKDKAITPPAPSANTPPAPAEPQPPKADIQPSDKKPDPPAPPSDPEPPKTPEKPDANAGPEIKKPDESVEPPKPPTPNEAEPPAPEPKKPLSVVEEAISDIQKAQPLTIEVMHPAILHAAPEPQHEEEAPAPPQAPAP